jgi:hypothetical protein
LSPPSYSGNDLGGTWLGRTSASMHQTSERRFTGTFRFPIARRSPRLQVLLFPVHTGRSGPGKEADLAFPVDYLPMLSGVVEFDVGTCLISASTPCSSCELR